MESSAFPQLAPWHGTHPAHDLVKLQGEELTVHFRKMDKDIMKNSRYFWALKELLPQNWKILPVDMYSFKSVKKLPWWKTNPIMISATQFKEEIWQASMSWWHVCTTQPHTEPASPFLHHMFQKLHFDGQPHYAMEVIARFLPMKSLFSLPLFSNNWPTVRIWDCHSTDGRLR